MENVLIPATGLVYFRTPTLAGQTSALLVNMRSCFSNITKGPVAGVAIIEDFVPVFCENNTKPIVFWAERDNCSARVLL